MKFSTFFLIVSLQYFTVSGQTFYLSNKGSDDYKSPGKLTPWLSLRKLQDHINVLKPGDSILFERGSVFFGTLSIQGVGWKDNPIYLGSYGTGPKPVITGSTELKGWRKLQNNIWVAECAICINEPGNIFIQGESQPLGRYPNGKYLPITKSLDSESAFADTTMQFADGFWNGAEIVVKSTRWTIDKIQLENYSSKTFLLAHPASNKLQKGFGYFIQNHLSTLDKNGEWFFDKTTGQIFLYWKTEIRDTVPPIEVSVLDVGLIISNSESILVENITFKNQRTIGVSVSKTNDISLNNLDIENAGANGLALIGCKDPKVWNTRIAGSGNNGVIWADNINGHFHQNAIVKTGLNPGRGASGNGTYIGLSITSTNPTAGPNVIESNRIDSVGYLGIDFRTGHTLIKNNVVTNFCMIKDDGAGIYTWNNTYGNNSIEENLVLHGWGSADGTPDPTQLFTSGIYIDDRSGNIRVTRNTVAFCPSSGIFVHNANAIEITENKLYGNGDNLTNQERGQLLVKLDGIVPTTEKPPLNLTVKENIFVSMNEGSYGLYLSVESEQDLEGLGTFTGNQYRGSKAEQGFVQINSNEHICNAGKSFDLSQWQAATSLELGSKFIAKPIENVNLVGNNLIINSKMTKGTSGWIIWPEPSQISHDIKHLIDGPSLKAKPAPDNTEALLYHAGIVLDEKKTYCLTFSAKSEGNCNIEFVPLAATEPWNALGKYTCFSLDSTIKTFTYCFTPTQSSNSARVNFKSNSTFWIDNVRLHEVLPNSLKKNQSLNFIYNARPEPFANKGGKNLNDPIRGNWIKRHDYDSLMLPKPE